MAESEPSPGPSAKPSWRRGFWSLILTQFQGAFNDNALKFLVIYLIVAMNLPEHERDFLVLIIGRSLRCLSFCSR